RAIRLAQMMGLDRMDAPEPSVTGTLKFQQTLPPAQSQLDLEERRKAFWVLFIIDTYASVRTGTPVAIDQSKITIVLPSNPKAPETNLPPMPQLQNASTLYEAGYISSFTGLVLMVSLCRRCLNHSKLSLESELNTTGPGYCFWEQHYDIDKDLKNCTDAVIGKMDAQALLEDDFALALDINLRAIDIFLHEAAIFRAGKDGLPHGLMTESNSRCSQAAMRIVNGVSLSQTLAEPKKALFKLKNIFAMWPVCMAMQVLDRQLSATNDNAELGHIVGMLRTLVAAIEDLEDVSGHWIGSISHILKRLEDIDPNSIRTSNGEAQGAFLWDPNHTSCQTGADGMILTVGLQELGARTLETHMRRSQFERAKEPISFAPGLRSRSVQRPGHGKMNNVVNIRMRRQVTIDVSIWTTGDEAVFPAAGYFGKACEDTSQLNELSFRDVLIKNALFTPDGDDRIEVTQHETINPSGGCPQRATGKSWNQGLRDVGFHYATTFQDMQDICHDSKTYAAARKIAVKNQVSTMVGESRHVLHLAAVDSAFQLLIVSIYAGRANVMPNGAVPHQVDEIAMFTPNFEQLENGVAGCNSWIDQRGLRPYISDMRRISYGAALPQRGEEPLKPQLYGEMVWKLDIDYVQCADKLPSLSISDLVGLSLCKLEDSHYTIAETTDENVESVGALAESFKNAKVQKLDMSIDLESQGISAVKMTSSLAGPTSQARRRSIVLLAC
ncbi:MAG: hypothetical protein LQ341_006775, partial [Variospora aurantia]